MNKSLLFAVMLTLSASLQPAFAQLIPWQPETRLTWNNFVAPPDPQSSYAALTYCVLNYKWKWDSDGIITVTIECSFDPARSWKKPERNLTPEMLRHEQLHFDVAELHARKMRQAFTGHAGYAAFHKHTDSTANDLKKIFERIMTECNAYNALYDNESDHSRNKTKQAEWDKKISADLRSLSSYASQ